MSDEINKSVPSGGEHPHNCNCAESHGVKMCEVGPTPAAQPDMRQEWLAKSEPVSAEATKPDEWVPVRDVWERRNWRLYVRHLPNCGDGCSPADSLALHVWDAKKYRDCTCGLAELMMEEVATPVPPIEKYEADFCTCDYRPKRPCVEHPESVLAPSQVKAEGVREPSEIARNCYEAWRGGKYPVGVHPWPHDYHADVCEFAEWFAASSVAFLERELGNFRRNAAHRAEPIAEEKLAPMQAEISRLTQERDDLVGIAKDMAWECGLWPYLRLTPPMSYAELRTHLKKMLVAKNEGIQRLEELEAANASLREENQILYMAQRRTAENAAQIATENIAIKDSKGMPLRAGNYSVRERGDEIADTALQLCYAIEELPASEQQTKVSLMANKLQRALAKGDQP